MRLIRPISTRLTPWGRITAVAMIGVMVAVMWLAADPLAHAKLHAYEAPSAHAHTSSGCSHHDAHHHEAPASDQPAEDTCVIALFAEGHLGQSFGSVQLTGTGAEFIARVFSSARSCDGASDIRQPPGRAPPGV